MDYWISELYNNYFRYLSCFLWPCKNSQCFCFHSCHKVSIRGKHVCITESLSCISFFWFNDAHWLFWALSNYTTMFIPSHTSVHIASTNTLWCLISAHNNIITRTNWDLIRNTRDFGVEFCKLFLALESGNPKCVAHSYFWLVNKLETQDKQEITLTSCKMLLTVNKSTKQQFSVKSIFNMNVFILGHQFNEIMWAYTFEQGSKSNFFIHNYCNQKLLNRLSRKQAKMKWCQGCRVLQWTTDLFVQLKSIKTNILHGIICFPKLNHFTSSIS